MSKKILIVDDSASDRLIIQNMLSEYEIYAACDGAEALKVLDENEDINFMILDLNMPNMNGFEVLEALGKQEKYRRVRTLILTNYDEIENEIKGLNLGAVDYIRKPIHISSLKKRIHIHFELYKIQQVLESKLYEKALTIDTIFQQAPIGIAVYHSINPFSSDNLLLTMNPVFEEITGRTRDEIANLGWIKFTHPDDIEEDLRLFKKLQKGELYSYSLEKRYIKPDGSIVWVDLVISRVEASDYQNIQICLIQDITQRKKLEAELRESERSKSVLLSNLPGMAYRCKYDRDWTMLFVSDGCHALTGYKPESLINNKELTFNELITPEYREVLWEEWNRILENRSPFKFEYEITTASGQRKWVLEMGQGVFNQDGKVEALEGIILDITDRKHMEDHLRYINEHEKFTGLYNRDYFEKLLEYDLKKNKDLKKALLGINLNTVQLLTSNYGFLYTQGLIKAAAEALSQYTSENLLLFQTHENRFLFYIKNYRDKDDLMQFSDEIVEMLESLFRMERIGGGIGILEIDQEDNLDVDSLLRRLLIATEKSIRIADREFRACFYDKDFDALVNREREIRELLAKIAAEENDKELYLQYQPIYCLKNNQINGFEALARLKSEKLGLVSPLEFIPLAEQTKLIIPIGEKVIVKALNFIKRINDSGINNINISINVSAIQLLRPDFVQRMISLIEEFGVNPTNVGIEITESVFSSDFEYINDVLFRLRDYGLHIAIDDFGTGYSSMAREGELKINCLKIDKYFIDKLLKISPDKNIVGDIISMAHRLGHCVIAEGVEYEEQKSFLEKSGCDMIQGYLISRPLDEDVAFNLISRQIRGK